MKKNEIVKGATYSNGKQGRYHAIRRVLELGPQFRLYESQAETDNLSYAIVKGKQANINNHGFTAGGEKVMHSTRASFASWAKERVIESSEA